MRRKTIEIKQSAEQSKTEENDKKRPFEGGEESEAKKPNQETNLADIPWVTRLEKIKESGVVAQRAAPTRRHSF